MVPPGEWAGQQVEEGRGREEQSVTRLCMSCWGGQAQSGLSDVVWCGMVGFEWVGLDSQRMERNCLNDVRLSREAMNGTNNILAPCSKDCKVLNQSWGDVKNRGAKERTGDGMKEEGKVVGEGRTCYTHNIASIIFHDSLFLLQHSLLRIYIFYYPLCLLCEGE